MKIKTKCTNCKKDIIKYTRNKIIHNWFCSLKCKSEYSRKLKYETIKCNYCNILFKRLKSINKNKKKFFCSKKCYNKSLTSDVFYITVKCDECKKLFKKYKNYIKRGNKKNFCSTICYNKYRRKNSIFQYRLIAFEKYEKKCENCGYDKIKDILEVHHIDKNRKNNKIENLIILCPNCHAILTLGIGYIKDRKIYLK